MEQQRIDIGGWDSTADCVGEDIRGLGWAVYRDNKVIALFSTCGEAETFYEALLIREGKTHDFHRQDVQELLDVLCALGVLPDGYCFNCSKEQMTAGHTGECREAREVLKKHGLKVGSYS